MEIDVLRDVLGNEFAFIFTDINPVLQNLELEKSAKILDVGTGMGWMAIILALNNYEVTTGEPENDESEYAKQDWLESVKKVNLDHMITYVPFNAEDMPFEDANFDAIFILGSLHHIDDKEAALKECIRVLRANGIVCIFEPNSKLLKIIHENKFPSHPDAVNPLDYAQDFQLSSELIERPFYNAYILRKQ
ncbi:MAG: class I SAM-dependent methyltransferase [Candidatus Thorarchaeota archaeon]